KGKSSDITHTEKVIPTPIKPKSDILDELRNAKPIEEQQAPKKNPLFMTPKKPVEPSKEYYKMLEQQLQNEDIDSKEIPLLENPVAPQANMPAANMPP